MKSLTNDERAQMGALDVEECLVLLRWEVIGRLAVAIPGAAPSVVPINFAVDGNTVVFRTGEGEKLDHLRENLVSLQVDRFDWFRRIGWSILVQGVAQECDAIEAEALDLAPWAPGEMHHVIRIVPTSITGRRLELAPSTFEPRGYL